MLAKQTSMEPQEALTENQVDLVHLLRKVAGYTLKPK